MNALYSFARSNSWEILLRYCRLAIAAEDERVLPVTIRFITWQGRMKYIRPPSRALHESEIGRFGAAQTFLASEDSCHPIGAEMVASDLVMTIKSRHAVQSTADEEEDEDDVEIVNEQLNGNGRFAWAVGVAAVTVAFAIFRRRRR